MSISFITPCFRAENLQKIYATINFDRITKWYIVYDTTKDRKYTKQFEGNPKISEYECSDYGISGNAQRNYGMNLVIEGFVYFLDDDNIIHPDFWKLQVHSDYFYTFNQRRGNRVLKGNNINVGGIDTAMYLVHKKHIQNTLWKLYVYDADGYFISEIFKNNKEKWIYKNKILSYYNYLYGK